MARKKRQTYNEMIRTMEDLQERAITEKDRIAGVLVSELEYEDARVLGDFSDSELKRVANLMFSNLELYVNKVIGERRTSKQHKTAEDDDFITVDGALKYNFSKHIWEIVRCEGSDEVIGELYHGMDVELETFNGDWVPCKMQMSITDHWSMRPDKEYRDKEGETILLCGGQRVRIHKAQA